MICIFMMRGKGLVSRDAASCVPGVKCFFIHYYCGLLKSESYALMFYARRQDIGKPKSWRNFAMNKKMKQITDSPLGKYFDGE